ncbi:MAG: hypothetical protein V4616_07645 [Bacteroidota bacterium]
MKTVGIILSIVGLIMLIWTGFSFTKKKKVVDLGKLEINKNETEHVNWSPYAGGVLLLGGIVLIFAGKKGNG